MCRILSSPFKATDKRFKDIEPMNSATYKIPADNITNTNAKIITSMFKSTSPQISLLSKVPERSAEALDYEPRWDKINKNSPMKVCAIQGHVVYCFCLTRCCCRIRLGECRHLSRMW